MDKGDKDGEKQKSNTDCRFFLASPSICRNGNRCDFRHIEDARINPTCYYWLAGRCMNPGCHYRHPPLQGRHEVEPAAAFPQQQPPLNVPCYFYINGFCSKGERCPFVHGIAAGSSASVEIIEEVDDAPCPSSDSSQSVEPEILKEGQDKGNQEESSPIVGFEPPEYLGSAESSEVGYRSYYDMSIVTKPFSNEGKSEMKREITANTDLHDNRVMKRRRIEAGKPEGKPEEEDSQGKPKEDGK